MLRSRYVTPFLPSSVAMRWLTASTLARVASGVAPRGKMPSNRMRVAGDAAMELGADRRNAGGDFVGRVQIDVVGANHHDDHLRAHVIEFAVRESPEHVLGAVPAVAEVHDAAAGKEPIPFVPSRSAARRPARRPRNA